MEPNSEKTGFASAKERFLELLEGQKVLVDCSEGLPVEKPSWYDEDKFNRGRQLFRKYYSGIFLSNLCSLLLLLISPHVVRPLIYTGKSETRWKAFKRYLATVIHVNSWYLGNIWEEGNPARRSLLRVKKYHSRAAVTMNKPEIRPSIDRLTVEDCPERLDLPKPMRHVIAQDLEHIGECPFADLVAGTSSKVYDAVPFVNQYEMSMTQFAFFGFVVLFPEKFGLPLAKKQDLEGLIHFWRCIGYLLGIEDRFNFCREDNLESTKQLCAFTLDNVMIPSLKRLTPESEHMTAAIANGMQFYLPGYSFEGLFMYIFWVLNLDVPRFLAKMELNNWIHCTILKWIYCYAAWIPGVVTFFNGVLKLALTLVVCPPSWWPESKRPPRIVGLTQYWIE